MNFTPQNERERERERALQEQDISATNNSTFLSGSYPYFYESILPLFSEVLLQQNQLSAQIFIYIIMHHAAGPLCIEVH